MEPPADREVNPAVNPAKMEPERTAAATDPREQEEPWRAISDNIPDGATYQNLTQPDGTVRYTHISAGVEQLFGLTAASVLADATVLRQLVAEEDRPRVAAAEAEALRCGKAFDCEFRWRTVGGDVKWVHCRSTARRLGNGSTLWNGVIIDITARKLAEEKLRRSEALYRAIGESIDYGVWVCSPDGRNTYASESFLRLVGITQQQCSDFGWGDVLHPDDAARTIAAWKECCQTGGTWDIEHRFRGVDGRYHAILARGVPVRDEEGKVICWAGINLDISRLKQAEEDLRQQAQLLDLSHDAIIVWDFQGTIEYWNEGAERLYGFSRGEAVGHVSHDLLTSVYPGGLAAFRAALEGDGEWTGEVHQTTREGRAVIVESRVQLIRRSDGRRVVLETNRDLTERRRAEELHRRLEQQMQQAQKDESLWLLAGGVAHDFNNLLTVVLGNLGLAAPAMPAHSPALTYLQRAEEAASHAAELCQQMLAYAGKAPLARTTVQLNQLLQATARLIQASVSKQAELVCHLTEPLPSVHGDPSRLRQVILNLLINASEAIGDRTGRITLTTGAARRTGEDLRSPWVRDPLPTGHYVFLEVADTGCGIEPSACSRIFDPFFSTKFTGRGLGLAVVLGIVRGHHGTVQVESAPGQGTLFRIWLPAVRAETIAPTPLTAAGPRFCGSGTILVVDDEELIRCTAEHMLKRFGFDTVCARDGLEALDIFRAEPKRFWCVLLDVTMPRLDGEATLRELVRIHPEVRVILSSGYAKDDVLGRCTDCGALSGFLQKPYTVHQLAAALAQVSPTSA